MDTGRDLDEGDDHTNVNHADTLQNNDPDPQEEHADSGSAPDGHAPISFQRRKWNRLRKRYNDQYLDLFNNTFDRDNDYDVNADLAPTQLGAVIWHPDEKAKLYQALCRRGRHDLPALAHLIGSKSVIEVKAYLDNLREQETDRQRFEAQPKNVSHAEIPAAVEIGPECEAVLDGAADALLAFQEQYDHVTGQQQNDMWLINHDVAGELDEKTGDGDIEDEVNDQEFDGQTTSMSKRAIVLFRLSAFLELSERLFMNKGPDNPDSWQNMAEQGERPSLTLDATRMLYDLIVNFLRRLVQSCLFITQSRIRASTTRDYRPSGIVKPEDVLVAQDVLGVNSNTKSYWVELARRNGLKVVDDAHRRGIDINSALAYDHVEESLSQSGRSRSVSVALRADLEEDSSSEENSDSSGRTESEDDHSGGSKEEDNIQEPDGHILPYGDVSQDLPHGTQTEDDVSGPERHSDVRMPRHKRLQILEDAQDEYLERMDQGSRKQEEALLMSLLGAEDLKQTAEENMDGLGVRPRELRKSVEDCVGWDVNYEAGWEYRAKRRRLDTAEQ